ncbi:TolC family protein [Pseudomonas sp. CF161]|uniref:TolC family protein n=1 Tax=Pseudomonas sp. CF161 TaxID=911241 RepID=UPI0005BBCFC7
MTDLYRRLGLCFALFFGTGLTAAAATPTPSRATMPGHVGASMRDQAIDLTLSDAIYLGLRNNRAIHSAYLQRIAQKFDLRVAQDQFTPTLVLSSRYLASRNQSDGVRQAELTPTTTLLTEIGTRLSLSWSNQSTQANQGGRVRNDGANFTLIQPLLRGAGQEVATAPMRLARLSEQINRLSLKATVSRTITDIARAYRELLRAQEQVRIARDALARSRQLLEVNRAMIDGGRMAEFEIVQTEADAATQELGVEEASNQLDASRLELLRLLALDLKTSLEAVDRLDTQRIEPDLAKALSAALLQQPGYLSQLIAVEQADINLTVARNNRLWDLSLVGGATQARDRYDLHTDRRWEGYAGIQVDIPIGDLSRRQGEVRAQVDVETQGVQLAEARQVLERQVSDGVRDIGTRWRQYEIAQRAQELSQRKLDIEREKLQAGRSSNFQVLSFEADLRNAENARLNALIAYLNAQAELDLTLGMTLESWDIALND